MSTVQPNPLTDQIGQAAPIDTTPQTMHQRLESAAAHKGVVRTPQPSAARPLRPLVRRPVIPVR